ncbi:alkene reductase [Acetobacter cibinongensis]|uniref:Alkene reductase n=1 Tax=Acetobacter cibinongensis TaxID=146475 RepID=A0A0D6N1G0_9PROT|nr:alkene reductase [Acetobacter cibinongensis]GAN59398.1 NADH:flavin oxidoreductase/N-ethylmaleimide reductase [Acetobacter cibinongensis]GBQ15575.1 NADH:flavin oxidoreductase [Acetobacter cibinongensis NRIC 0482]GEL59742.1 alkene reductase [Acetobacter cibinongensis]
MSKLFTPFTAGALSLAHRVVMAPLTRLRADPGDKASALMRDYYTQRTSQGGLIISEATPVAREGYGYAGAPGIYEDAQIEGWRAVTEAVHARGGKIVMQLWHVGRQSHPELQPGGKAPVAPSAIQAEGDAYTPNGPRPFSMPRALERHEIPAVIDQFRQGAARAKAAGFDGVEIHGANGYLPDQFLQDGTNHRTDEYGGPIENRARFLLEITQAAIEVWGADRVGVRISPSGTYGSMSDSNPQETFGYIAEKLSVLGIAYLHIVEPRIKGTELISDSKPVAAQQLRQHFHGTLLAAGGFTGESAEAILQAGDADAVAFGRFFISNPDLPERLRHTLPLTEYDRTTFYGGGTHGYTDYPKAQSSD